MAAIPESATVGEVEVFEGLGLPYDSITCMEIPGGHPDYFLTYTKYTDQTCMAAVTEEDQVAPTGVVCVEEWPGDGGSAIFSCSDDGNSVEALVFGNSTALPVTNLSDITCSGVLAPHTIRHVHINCCYD